MAFDGMPSFEGVHVGCVASAFVLRQTPPPAAPTSSVQDAALLEVQFDEIARLVTRPEFVVGRPVYVASASTFGVIGPSSVQWAFLPYPFCSMDEKAVYVPIVCGYATVSFGKARFSYSSWAGPRTASPPASDFSLMIASACEWLFLW